MTFMTHIIKRVEQLGKNILKIEVVGSDEDSNKLITYLSERKKCMRMTIPVAQVILDILEKNSFQEINF